MLVANAEKGRLRKRQKTKGSRQRLHFFPQMKFKLTDFTGIIRMKSFSIPVVVHNTKRDQIDVVI